MVAYRQPQDPPPDGIIEPPILDFLASLAYAISGGEHLWIPRVLSTCFWMVGGVFLYLILRKIVSPNAALFSVAFFLFVPSVVLYSSVFMPDPLMVMLLLLSVLTILHYHELPAMSRLLVAAAASSAALFVKPGICLFQIVGVFVALMLYRKGSIRALISMHLLVFTVLILMPTGLYYACFSKEQQRAGSIPSRGCPSFSGGAGCGRSDIWWGTSPLWVLCWGCCSHARGHRER